MRIRVEAEAGSLRAPDPATAVARQHESMFAELRPGAPALVTAAFAAAMGMAGLPLFTLPLFIGPLHEAFGWARADIGVAYTILAMIIFIGSPFVGRIADRVGARRVALVSIVLLAAGMWSVTQVERSLYAFYACYLAIGVGGGGTTYVCYSRVVSTWFQHHRGLALGLMMSGPGLVAGLGPVLLAPVIAAQGWRYAWTLMSIAVLLAWPLVWAFLRDGPVALRSLSAGAVGVSFIEARRTRTFWCMALAVFTVTLAATGTHIHIIAIATGMGEDPSQAAAAASALGLSMLLGRLICGVLVDRVFAPIVGCTMTLLAAVAVLAAAAFGLPPLWMAIGIGLVFGMESDFMAYAVTRYFGLRSYSEIFGWIFGFMALGSASSPIWVGRLHAQTGGYETGLFISAGLLLMSAVAIASMGRYPKTVGSHGGTR